MLNKGLLIVLVIHCHVTNYPKFSILKHYKVIISHNFCGLGIWERLSLVVLAKSLSWDYSQGQLGLQSTEGLNGAGGSISKMIHSCDCWQETPAPHRVNLSIWLPECAHDMAAPRSEWSRRARWDVKWVTQVSPIQGWKDLHESMDTRRWN